MVAPSVMATPAFVRNQNSAAADRIPAEDLDAAFEHTAPAMAAALDASASSAVSSARGKSEGHEPLTPPEPSLAAALDLTEQAALAATQAAPSDAGPSSPAISTSRAYLSSVGQTSDELYSEPPPASVPGYRLLRSLGRGAFGTVWLGEQENTGKLVAIKFYSHAPGLDFKFLQREVEKLAALYTSREIVQLIEVGWHASPPYYVMEYLERGSLEDRLRQGPMSDAEAVRILRSIARALAQAHSFGILHCDLKPANVLLDSDLRPRLCDFGQSRLTSEQQPSLGTFFYMAPEQADLDALPDARWDVYALGAITYAMLTGSPPYRTRDARKLLADNATLPNRLLLYQQILRSAPSPLTELRRKRTRIDNGLRELISECLSLEPDARPNSAQAVLDALKELDARRARRPVLIIGAVGLVLLFFVVSLIGRQTWRTALGSSQKAITQRALESTRFAARFVAETAGREVERRWGALEGAAGDPMMRDVLIELGQSPSAEGQSPLGSDSEALYHAQRRKALQAVLQEWLQRREQQHHVLGATSWFLTDVHGLQWARVPYSPTIGKNWAFRDYFHGRGRDLKTKADGYGSAVDVAPIRAPHRSAVFDSQASGNRIVAFSVPVWSEPSESGPPEVVGVLGMTVQLGHFGELNPGERQGAQQVAALIDSREDQPGQRGLILQHPQLSRMLAQRFGKTLMPRLRVDPEVLNRLDQARLAMAQGDASAARLLTFVGYVDPLGVRSGGDWLAALEPVVVRGRDTGWAVIVQEPYSDVTKPVTDLGRHLLRIGIIGFLSVLILLGGLWWLLLRAVDRGTRPRPRRGVASQPKLT